MQPQAEPRVRRRVPCAFSVEGSRHNGLVLNLSRGGLFVQTSVPAQRGDEVRVDLVPSGGADPIVLAARVVWKRVVGARLRTVVQGGMGLRIESAPETWYAFLSSALGAEPSAAALPHFRVRVGEPHGPRSRSLLLRCSSEDEARAQAVARTGPGWRVLELRRED